MRRHGMAVKHFLSDLLTPAGVRRSTYDILQFQRSRRGGCAVNCCSAAGVGRAAAIVSELSGLQLQASFNESEAEAG